MLKHDYLDGPGYGKNQIIYLHSACQKMKDSSNSLKAKLLSGAELKNSPGQFSLANIAVLETGQKCDITLSVSADESWNLDQSLRSLKFVLFLKISKKKRSFESIIQRHGCEIDMQFFQAVGRQCDA